MKINRIKAKHKVGMDLLGDILQPKVLHVRVPRLEAVAGARIEHRDKMADLTKTGSTTRRTGFIPSGNMQYVAQVDQSVWAAVLEVFGDELYPPGEPMNRDLFYALMAGPLADYDLRNRTIV